MTIEIRDERFVDVVGADIELEVLGTGFEFTEGPIWHHIENHLTFSDMPGDHMRQWASDGSIETFRKPSSMANGNAYDRQGRIVTCEHATSRVTRTEFDGSITALATHYKGKELNSPNDIVVRSDGEICFTDPTYGRLDYYGVERNTELDFQGIYRVNADGSDLTLLADDFGQPNGLCYSLDETRLFVNDTENGHIRAFGVSTQGAITGGEVWADVTGDGDGAPDGLKLDVDENVYCCGPGGLHVFSPDATCLGVVLVPEVVANFCWGGRGMQSVFLTASTSLYRFRSKTSGPILF